MLDHRPPDVIGSAFGAHISPQRHSIEQIGLLSNADTLAMDQIQNQEAIVQELLQLANTQPTAAQCGA